MLLDVQGCWGNSLAFGKVADRRLWIVALVEGRVQCFPLVGGGRFGCDVCVFSCNLVTTQIIEDSFSSLASCASIASISAKSSFVLCQDTSAKD